MITTVEQNTDPLEKQAGPIPDKPAASSPSSIFLYLMLILFSTVLIFAAFSWSEPDWPSLMLNLSTEIIGAVIIILLVERRLRNQDILYLKGIQQGTRSALRLLFSHEMKEIKHYAEALSIGLLSVDLRFYFPRPKAENSKSMGIMISGAPGDGKSTVLHKVIQDQSLHIIKDPKHGKVPVLITVADDFSEGLDQIIYGSVEAFFSFQGVLLANFWRGVD